MYLGITALRQTGAMTDKGKEKRINDDLIKYWHRCTILFYPIKELDLYACLYWHNGPG